MSKKGLIKIKNKLISIYFTINFSPIPSIGLMDKTTKKKHLLNRKPALSFVTVTFDISQRIDTPGLPPILLYTYFFFLLKDIK